MKAYTITAILLSVAYVTACFDRPILATCVFIIGLGVGVLNYLEGN